MKTFLEKRVMNYQMDSFNIVHHARYLEFMEEGRWLYCFENNLIDKFIDRELYHVIANINIDYKSSATFGELLTITTELSGVTSKSIIFKQMVLRNNQAIVTARITNVFLNKKSNVVINVDELMEFWEDLKVFHKNNEV